MLGALLRCRGETIFQSIATEGPRVSNMNCSPQMISISPLPTTMRLLIATTIYATVMLAIAPQIAAQQIYQPHSLLRHDMSPGVVGGFYAARGPSIGAYVQPVHINVPDGVGVTMPVGATFGQSSNDLMVGLKIGDVHRFRLTGIAEHEGEELYPTIEVIDRTYPPPGLQLKYPIRVDIDQDDLRAALTGQMVTRVIYLEDTEAASQLAQRAAPERPLDVAVYQDPLDVADELGRPVAILRLGSLTPPSHPELLAGFYFGFPIYYPIHAPVQSPVNEATQ